jgi:SAM-dependent methyltransferase
VEYVIRVRERVLHISPEYVRRSVAFRSARRRMLSPGGLSAQEQRLLGADSGVIDHTGGTATPSELSPFEREALRHVSLRVHKADKMYQPGNPGHYLAVGLSAIRCIQAAMAASGRRGSPQWLLDFACGHGRVLRFLKVMFRDSQIVACDLDRSAVSFCHRAFSVPGLISNPDFRQLSLPSAFDLIWCGSLITHIDENATIALLRIFHDHLSQGGVCVFSTHGELSADWIERGVRDYGLSQQGCKAVLKGYRHHGYGYSDYQGRAGYGISVVSRQCIEGIASSFGDWEMVMYLPRGWGNHHDVYTFIKE